MARAELNESNESDASKTQPWKGICSSGCYNAKTDKKKCECRCRGKLHGKAHAERYEEMKIDEIAHQRDPK